MATPAQQKKCASPHYYVGATIDERYHLVDFVGAGGMACVYRAREKDAPLEFAIKFLKEEYHNMPYLVEYFEDEARGMRDLAHPNIVRFYRFVNHDNFSYIIMAYVNGFSLAEVLKLARTKGTAMPIDEVVRVMTQIARALDAIHRENFVHRDIKPGNVLIERESGQAFLTDLGITSPQNTLMEGAGTIAYMSPEQAETWMADSRSDVYAYGILVYEMLSGKRPFNVKPGLHGSEAEADLLRKHKEMPVPDVTQLRSGLPQEINAILAKAMAKKPDDRYDSVIDFARDMHTALKPQLPDDLQDFASIQHRKIDAPVIQPRESQNLLRLLVGIGIAILLFAGVLIANEIVIPDTTPTMMPSPMPTATSLAEGLIELAILTDLSPFSEPDAENPLLVEALENEVVKYLRVGYVDGFSVQLDIADASNAGNYGIAFRMRDAQNYHYIAFSAVPDDEGSVSWRIYDVVDGNSQGITPASVIDTPQQIRVSGIGNTFEIRIDNQAPVAYQSDLYPEGSLAVYLDSGQLLLNSIRVSLSGETQPVYEDTIGLADPLRFIYADLLDLMATDDTGGTITVNCIDYIEIYDNLDRHDDSDNATVRDYSGRIEDAGESVYDICDSEAPGQSNYAFSGSNSNDLNRWRSAFRTILSDMEQDLSPLSNE